MWDAGEYIATSSIVASSRTAAWPLRAKPSIVVASTASVLVGAQVDAKTIQEIMGHSDILTTLNRDASARPQGRKKASAAMDEFMNTQVELDAQQPK